MALQKHDMILALALQNQVIALLLFQKEKKKRSVWVHELWKQRKLQGHHDNLIKEMRLKDHTTHFNYFRMLPSMFDELLSLVGPSIVRKGSNFQEPLSPSLKIGVTLRYLATGESQASLSFNFRIGRSTVCEILNKVPKQIWNVISPISMAVPKTHSKWKRLADDVWNLLNFPLCLGAID